MAEVTSTQATSTTLGTDGNITVGTGTVTADPSISITAPEAKAKGNSKEPNAEELALQLAKANAENARFKNSIDKLTHENKELTAWKRERMTAAEQQTEEEARAKEQMEQRIKELEAYQAINEASKRYIEMGMNVELATETATAEVNGEMDVVMKNINQNKEDALAAAKAEWLKSRPDILAGGDGKSITKEQFDSMSIQERTKLFRSDPESYQRLVGRK